MKLLGVTGPMGSGKSTIFNILKEIHPAGVVNVKFAAPLYAIQEYIYGKVAPVYSKPRGFAKDRKLLQWLGTEWGRDTIDKDIWIKLWKHEVEFQAVTDPRAIIFCDDVRFDNEAKALKDMGGTLIELKNDNVRPAGGKGYGHHASENGVDLHYIDYILENNGSIQDLQDSLLALNSKLGIW